MNKLCIATKIARASAHYTSSAEAHVGNYDLGGAWALMCIINLGRPARLEINCEELTLQRQEYDTNTFGGANQIMPSRSSILIKGKQQVQVNDFA